MYFILSQLLQTYNHWLEHIQFKVAIAASYCNSNMISHHLCCYHCYGFTLSRIHFSWAGERGKKVKLIFISWLKSNPILTTYSLQSNFCERAMY